MKTSQCRKKRKLNTDCSHNNTSSNTSVTKQSTWVRYVVQKHKFLKHVVRHFIPPRYQNLHGTAKQHHRVDKGTHTHTLTITSWSWPSIFCVRMLRLWHSVCSIFLPSLKKFYSEFIAHLLAEHYATLWHVIFWPIDYTSTCTCVLLDSNILQVLTCCRWQYSCISNNYRPTYQWQ